MDDSMSEIMGTASELFNATSVVVKWPLQILFGESIANLLGKYYPYYIAEMLVSKYYREKQLYPDHFYQKIAFAVKLDEEHREYLRTEHYIEIKLSNREASRDE